VSIDHTLVVVTVRVGIPACGANRKPPCSRLSANALIGKLNSATNAAAKRDLFF
jgi:hypothetical protein